MMHAIRIHAYGGPEVMQLEELPVPVPGPGQALVRVQAASVNFLDVQKRRLLLCQMAKIREGRVIGVTSNEEKAKFVRDAGADEVIISKQADIAKEARRTTKGRGVDVVYDGVGKDTFEANLNSLAPGGYLVIYGQSSGYVPPFDLMTLQDRGSLFLTRTNGLPYLKEYPGYLPRFATWIREGRLSIRIHRTYPLEEAAQAHAALERRQISGRVLLLPWRAVDKIEDQNQ